MSKTISLSANFMRENPYFMGKLTPQQQKTWFSAFLGLLDNQEPTQGEAFQVSLDDIRAFIGSKQDNKHLRQDFIKAFAAIEAAYVPDCHRPFYLEKVERGKAFFRVGDPFTFAYQNGRGRQHFQINLDEVSSYKQEKNTKSRTIPLLWYCLAHRHLSEDKSHWEIDFGDYQLKKALGLGPTVHTTIPDHQRAFYIEASYYMEEKHTWELCTKLMEKYGFSTPDELEEKYYAVKESIHFKRFDFEQKVLLPAINELNSGHMINFLPREVWKRSPAGMPATKVQSYIGKNYCSAEAALVDGYHVIDKNVTNFRKLVKGGQYTFWIKK